MSPKSPHGELTIKFVLYGTAFQACRLPSRKEKPLRHVIMVAKSGWQQTENVNSHFLKLHWSCSTSFNLPNVSAVFWRWIEKNRIWVKKEKEHFCVVFTNSIKQTRDQDISCRRRAITAKYCTIHVMHVQSSLIREN